MKLLVLLLALLFGVWWWRRGQDRDAAPRRARGPVRRLTQVMVACDRCGVHVPEGKLVTGRSGRYCSEAHRQEAERV